MPRNGSGTYSLPSAYNPVVTGSVISIAWANNTLSDIATALTNSLTKDGQTTATANQPMGTYRHTNVGNATARTCYASVADVQDGSLVTLSAVAGTDTITATAPLSVAAYALGQCFRFTAANANTGAATININSLGAKSITKNGSTALAAGDIASGMVCEIVYDGTRFQLVGARQGGAVAAVTVNARSSNTIFGANDLGSMNQFTSTFTQTFTAAGTLGSGWYVDVQNIGTGVITFDANGAETFNTPGGARTTICMYPGEGFRIVCNGTGFDLVGRSEVVYVETLALSGATTDCETAFSDTEFTQIDMRFYAVTLGGGGVDILARVKKGGGAYLSSATYDYGHYYMTAAASAQVGATGATSWNLNAGRSLGNGATGVLSIGNPQASTDAHRILIDSNLNAGTAYRITGGLYQSTVGAIGGVRFMPDAGTFATGGVQVWGYRG